MVDSPEIVNRFDRFVAELFRKEGFEVITPPGGDRGYDLLLKSKSGTTAIVENKLFRSRVMPISTVVRAVKQTEEARRRAGATRGIIAFPSKVMRASQVLSEASVPTVVVYDYDALLFIAAKYPALATELESIVREAYLLPELSERSTPLQISTADLEQPVPERAAGPEREPGPAEAPATAGRALGAAIQTVKSGKPGAVEYELKVTGALKYIFENDLTAWSRQKVTERGMSRYDLVARVSSEHDFWRTIVGSFRSRYVIFEFKNYQAKIKQGEIYTTEKYLFATALRTTAIIISRKGADKNAEAASRGALKEAGKLIINLSEADVHKMLELRDDAKDHNGVLVDIVDDMLMTLER